MSRPGVLNFFYLFGTDQEALPVLKRDTFSSLFGSPSVILMVLVLSQEALFLRIYFKVDQVPTLIFEVVEICRCPFMHMVFALMRRSSDYNCPWMSLHISTFLLAPSIVVRVLFSLWQLGRLYKNVRWHLGINLCKHTNLYWPCIDCYFIHCSNPNKEPLCHLSSHFVQVLVDVWGDFICLSCRDVLWPQIGEHIFRAIFVDGQVVCI